MRKPARALTAVVTVAFAGVAYVYLSLPDVRLLRARNPTSTAFMELRAREAAQRGDTPRRAHRWVASSRISRHLKRAVLTAEDDAFWQHEGIDLTQIRKSIEVNLERGEIVRGASTITQQLAKNLYLSPSRSPLRKLRELFITRRLEAELSKERILEIYLNVIEWGDGIYGVEAASRTYFHKPAASLTPEEAALLAGAIVNPRRLNPANPSPGLRQRQRLILGRLRRSTSPVAEPAATRAIAPGGTPAIVEDETEPAAPADPAPTDPIPPEVPPGVSR